MKDKQFNVAFINAYFDFESYDEPVKYFIDDQLFFNLEGLRKKQANMYIMQSQMQLQDMLLQLGQQD